MPYQWNSQEYPWAERSKMIVDMRNAGKSLIDIASEFDITRERVCQIEKKARRLEKENGS